MYFSRLNSNGTENYRFTIVKIALPIILSSLISQVQMLIDRIFLGKLDVIYMSAVGNATAPMWTTISAIFALTTGTTILASQAIGKEDNTKALEFMASLFKYNNFLSIILFIFWALCPKLVYTAMGVSPEVMVYAVQYTVIYSPVFVVTGIGAGINSLLQVCSYTKPLVVTGIIRSLLNMVLDWLLIFGNCGFPAMGVAGAALATTIAEFAGGTVLILIVVKSKRLEHRPSIAQICSAKLRPFIDAIKMGFPSAAEDFAWNIGNLLLIRILNFISPVAAGVYTIVFGIEVIPVAIFGSLGNATLTLTGRETGKKDFVQLHKIVHTVMAWAIIVSFANLALYVLFPKPIMGLFTKDASIISMALVYITIIGIDLFPKSLNIIVGSGIRGFGDTKWMLYTQLFGTVFVVAVASLLVFVLKLGIAGVFAAVVCDEAVRCVINSLRFKRIGKVEPEKSK